MDNKLVELYKSTNDKQEIQNIKRRAIAVGLFSTTRELGSPLSKILSGCTTNPEIKKFVQSKILENLKNKIHSSIYNHTFLHISGRSPWMSLFGPSRRFAQAAKSGDSQKALALLQSRSIQPNRILDGIFSAAMAGHTETLLTLLPAIQSDQKKVFCECGFLIALLYNKDKTAIAIFDQNNVLININDISIFKDISPLMLATLFGNVSVLSALLHKGFSPNSFGYSCLSQAEHFGYEDCKTVLLEANAEKGNMFLDFNEISNQMLA